MFNSAFGRQRHRLRPKRTRLSRWVASIVRLHRLLSLLFVVGIFFILLVLNSAVTVFTECRREHQKRNQAASSQWPSDFIFDVQLDYAFRLITVPSDDEKVISHQIWTYKHNSKRNSRHSNLPNSWSPISDSLCDLKIKYYSASYVFLCTKWTKDKSEWNSPGSIELR